MNDADALSLERDHTVLSTNFSIEPLQRLLIGLPELGDLAPEKRIPC